MTATETPHLQFIWHLHQPYYSVPNQAQNFLPWVRLHAIKAYYDMGRMLQRFPNVHGVMNFSGSLLKQLQEYVDHGKRDTWWELTLKPAEQLTPYDTQHLLKHFFSINWETCIRPLPRYWELLQKRGHDSSRIDASKFSVDELRDLQLLFNLAWFGFSARDEYSLLRELREKGQNYCEQDKHALLDLQIEVMQKLAPMYRELHQSGQVEISVTPMYHPILPLIIDTDAASRATPDRPRPARFQATDDAHAHVEKALDIAHEYFGINVQGMWPAEGSVSPEAVEIFADKGVRWIATDEDVLRHSLGSRWLRERDLYRPWRLAHADQPHIFFRDHGLSDQLGFVYSKNAPTRAVDDFFERVINIASSHTHAPFPRLVSVILDGENPWEHYEDDGRLFLECLYERLSQTSKIVTTLPSTYLSKFPDATGELPTIHSGSWILGNYQIWIGHEDENRAWDLLNQTRQALTRASSDTQHTPDTLQSAWEALYIAEGSDWFWWYGDDFSSENDVDFDRLFRSQLRFVYNILKLSAPPELDQPILCQKSSEILFQPPKNLVSPTIDGRSEFFYEWSGAGVYRNTGAHGSMFENTRLVNEVFLGFDLSRLYVRINTGPDFHTSRQSLRILMRIQTPDRLFVAPIVPEHPSVVSLPDVEPTGEVGCDEVAWTDDIECAISFNKLGLNPGESFGISFSVWDESMEMERHPHDEKIELSVPDEAFELRHWIV